jgi:tetrahydromethanopterin S-methyltransferase subunit A
VITLDRTAGDILVHHYLPDHTPAHMVQGRHGESILLALLREKLISQKSHAGYLGAELAKAETALRLDLLYEQDRPLRLR